MRASNRVARAAGIIVITSLLSRVLGFVREQIMAAKFGLSGVTDAYFAAFTIPDILYTLLVGGALSSAFIPVFSSYLHQENEKEAWKFASIAINLVTLTMVIATILGWIYAPYLLPLVAYKLPLQYRELAIELTRIIFPSVIFTAFNGLQMGILHSYKHFHTPAYGSLLYNIGIIGTGLLLSPWLGIKGFSYGVVVGVFLSFLIQVPALVQHGLTKYYVFSFNLLHPGIRRTVRLMTPVVLAMSVNQINLVINQNFASSLDPGTISALRLANRLMMLPLGVFGAAIAVALFPNLNELVARGENKAFKEAVIFGLRATFFINIPAAVGLIALGVPIVRLLFEHGVFTHEQTLRTASILSFYALGIFAQAGLQMVMRGFYALHDTLTPLTFGLVTVALNYFLNATLIHSLGAEGLALAYTLTGMFDFITLLFLFRRKVGPLGLKSLVTATVKIVAVSAVMGISVWFIASLFEFLSVQRLAVQLAQVTTAVVLGAGLYLAFSMFLKMPEARFVLEAVGRRFR